MLVAIVLSILAMSTAQAQKLTGAGATFPFPIYSKWFSEYSQAHPGVEINYQSAGTGGLVVDFDAGVRLAVFAKPFGINGKREGRARPRQLLGLSRAHGQDRQHNGNQHLFHRSLLADNLPVLIVYAECYGRLNRRWLWGFILTTPQKES